MSRQSIFKETVFTHHSDQIRSYVYARTGCHETAEDITQEVFIRLHRVEGLMQIDNIRHYLFRIAKNLLIDHHRASRNRISSYNSDSIDEAYDLATDHPSPEDMLILREEISDVFSAIGEISDLCQRIFWQSRVEGFLNHEIAHMQGVCISTVEKNIARAKKRCINQMHAVPTTNCA